MDEEANVPEPLLDGQVPRVLGRPSAVGVGSHPGEVGQRPRLAEGGGPSPTTLAGSRMDRRLNLA